MNPLIPAADPMPLPAPAWLFHSLLTFTFFLHALFVNLALGGSVLATAAQAGAGSGPAGGRDGGFRTVLAHRLVAINSFAISLAITTGVAPLLFVQVLYGPLFYSAGILLGWLWLGFLLLLMAGYYATYVFKLRDSASGNAGEGDAGGAGWLAVSAVSFLLVAMVHVAMNLVHSRPELWDRMAASPWPVFADPVYVPRLLHFLLAAVGFSALVAAWWAVRQARAGREVETNRRIARYAWRWVVWTIAGQVIDGVVLLLLLPRHVLSGLLAGGAATLGPLATAILLGLVLLWWVIRVSDPAERPSLARNALALMTVTIAVMSITRHQVRILYLEPAIGGAPLAEAPQWGNVALFALLLVAGLATVAYMVRLVLSNRATGPDAA